MMDNKHAPERYPNGVMIAMVLAAVLFMTLVLTLVITTLAHNDAPFRWCI